MTVRINLLPHRERRRERRRKEFVVVAGFVAGCSLVVAVVVAMVIDGWIGQQRERNAFIAAESARLDARIGDIATLRAEIEALRARQAAVETLQADRTLPVHLLDELARHLPEGLFLKSLRQDDGRLSMVGMAQSNERISELLRALSNDSSWIERPELVEIKAVALAHEAGSGARAAPARRVYEFTVDARVRRPGAQPEAVQGARAASPRKPAPGRSPATHD